MSGLGRHAPDEDVDLAVRSLFALSVQLGDKPYLMGDTPCGTDATAFGALAGILTPFFTSPLRERTEQFRNLTDYVDRMMLQYYPDFWRCERRVATGRLALKVLQAPAIAGHGGLLPFNAASSASSSAIRASRAASAAATSAASNFCGMCCGQLVSQAEILNRITCSGRAL